MTKSIFIMFVFELITFSSYAQQTSSFTDQRDGKTYRTVKIGNQWWMAENLAYKPENSGGWGGYTGYWAYDLNEVNVEKYGFLYDWETAQNVCPEGWHLPSQQEFLSLINYLGGKDRAGKKLASTSGWNINGTNASGFNALPSGKYGQDLCSNNQGSNKIIFSSLHDYAFYWSSTSDDVDKAYCGIVYPKYSYAACFFEHPKSYGYAVRCIKN